MKKIILIIVITICALFAQSSHSFAFPKPTREHVEVFEAIIKPAVKASWETKQVLRDGEYLFQEIKEINLFSVNIASAYDFKTDKKEIVGEYYTVVIIFSARFYKNEIKYDEIQILESVLFTIKGDIIKTWRSLGLVELETLKKEFEI